MSLCAEAKESAEEFDLRVDVGRLGRAEIEHQNSRGEGEDAVAQRLDPADVAARKSVVVGSHRATIAFSPKRVNPPFDLGARSIRGSSQTSPEFGAR